MRLNLRRQISAFLISVLVMMSAVPHLTVAAAVSDQEGQEMTEDVLIGDNGTRYDSDYDPYIWDEEVEYYDEDSEEYSNFVRDYYGQDGVFTTVDGRQISLASTSNLASPSNLASLSDWVEMGELASPSNLASASDWEPFFETVVFTDAGPFLPAVQIGSARSRMRARAGAMALAASANESGLVMNKTAEEDPNKPGEYRVRLEAYTTGKVTTSTMTAPVDIVLVLDQSGSMAYDFQGKGTSINTSRRQYAMKQAVNNFIKSVSEKYNAASSDHRMAIVTFSGGSSVLKDWTFVDDKGKTSLQNGIENLPDSPSGATNVAAGMSSAENLMGSGYNYTGDHTTRQKVVIVFTDGVPTENSDFDTKVATDAIKSAKNLKNNGATVYSVGIFNGANPDELHGSIWKYETTESIPCSGNVDSYWGGSWAASLVGGNDFEDIDIAAGNRFLNYLSTNSGEAEKIGLKKGTFNPGGVAGIFGYGSGYRITENYTCENNGYYLTANDSDSLNNIFKTISQNISTADIILGTETVVDDIISPYFEVSEGSDISVKTADYQGNGKFGEDEQSGLDATETTGENGKQHVSVKGFNFDENYVTESLREINGVSTRGKKLIIEFNVSPKDGFLGGNGVPTNGAESGVYDRKDGQNRPVGKFEVPDVDVPIPDVTVEAAPKNVYLAGVLTDEDYQEGASVKCGDVVILGDGADNLEEWQSAYVDISALTVNRPAEALMGDNKYTLSCTVSPKESGSGSQNGKTGTSGVTDIHVYKPTITFHDGEIFYGESLPEDEHDYDANRYDSKGEEAIVWKHGDTVMTADTIMHGSKPELSFTYEYDASKVNSGTVNTRDALPIKVKAVTAKSQNDSNEQIVTPHVTLEHADCPSVGAGTDEMAAYPGYHFLLHVKTGTLTIKKIVEDGIGDGEPFIFTVEKDNESYTTCTVPGNGEITISELPLGIYTIEEETGKGSLAWRYGTPDYGNTGKQSKLTKDNPNLSFSCTNKIDNQKWLSGSARAVNERNAEGEQNTPETTRLSDMKGILGERKEWLGEFADSEASLYGRGMRNKPTGGDR